MKKHTIIVTPAEIKSDKTIAGKLEGIIRAAFPMAAKTGLANDVGTIKPEPKSRGKAVVFTWRKSLLKLTEALRVTEQDWKNDYVVGPIALDAQHIIDSHLHPAPVPQATEQQAQQEVATEAAVS